jgi:Trk K+ transport system NAD-binding subunit
MNSGTVLILGSGHLASRTKLLVMQKGFTVTHLPNLFSNLPSADSSTISETEKIFNDLDMKSFNMTYVLFEKDEDNLEIVIAMMALYSSIPITTSLFNENIRPHLENANKKLIILNPAKLAAPLFAKALDNPIERNQKSGLKLDRNMPKKKSNNSFLIFLISFFSLTVFSSVVYFHFSEQLSWLDALYFVVVTISTVGYGDINLLNSTELSKIIGIVLIVCSSIFIWLILSLLIDRIVKRRAQRSLGRKKYNYKNHVILCGLGRLGYFIAEELHKNGERIVVIESNQDSASIEYIRSLDIDVYIGNAREPQVLQDAGAEHCRALISVINNDYTNLEIGLNARYFQPDLRLVLRIFDESMAEVIKQKFDIDLTKSMSFITAEKFASILDLEHNDKIETITK